jgi:hypothetical protein
MTQSPEIPSRAEMEMERLADEALKLSCDAQFDLATKIAANVGYVLTGEPTFDKIDEDSSTPPTKNKGTFLGYRNSDGHEMHCAHAFCPNPIKCKSGCANRIALPPPSPQPGESEQIIATSGRIHKLKTWPRYFDAILSGEKKFECRVDDRAFKVGDTLVLQEWAPLRENYGCKEGTYTGREITKLVTFIFSTQPTHERTVVMSLRNQPGESREAIIEALEVPAYEFPYQQTFDAIAAATELYLSKDRAFGLSISVRKFQEAFNNHRDKRALAAARQRGEG